MKLPISWLKDYVDFEDTIEGLADKLTFSGTEVEGIITLGGDCPGVVVGEVLEKDQHPNADRLSVCQVNDGEQVSQVVCGAPNVEVGGKYPFARIGAVLKGGFKIKKAKLRGVPSLGMLCAEDELGLSDAHEGLMVLDAALEPGTPMQEVLGPPETIFELEVTPNRPDCLSIIGMAREVAAVYGKELKKPDLHFAKNAERHAEDLTSVLVEDEELCPRYSARVLNHVTIGESPEWMKKRLEMSGVRPINNVVDITNYVMLECGQPLHAFDQRLLKEGRIVVRRARVGECMDTLDGNARELNDDMLVIADAERAVALAGIMGGADSEIRDDTEVVLLESACFEADQVRSTARGLGMSTESSYRFERGCDIGGVEWASRRAAALLVQYAGAEAAEGSVDIYPHPVKERDVVCRLDTLNRLLGLQVDMNEMLTCFQRLALPVVRSDEESCTVYIPTFRKDLEREVDLVEEFSRIYGLDNIPEPAPLSRVVPGAEDRQTRALYRCRQRLCDLGLNEIQNYSLVSEKMLDLFGTGDQSVREVLPHPISQDQSVLRTALLPQMVSTLGSNRAHQVTEVALFESGKVFRKNASGQPEEEERIAIGLYGPLGRDAYSKRKAVEPAEAFSWLKGLVESVFRTQRLGGWTLKAAAHEPFESPYSVSIMLGEKEIGRMGLITAALRNEWRFSGPVAVAEFSTAPLLVNSYAVRTVVAPGIYPPIERDIAMLVDRKIRHEEIVRVIKEAAPEELEKVELFDIYESKEMDPNRKSVAYSLTYRSWDKTLTDKEANAYHNTVKQALCKVLQVEMREG